ncbi:MAG TPA: nuclear transport factor 2 family protein [Gemmatimonadaceae bacterium]|jgi:ketosteroid isomerase-like protein|nr:nuclear transport factor 2 family protein [Gemmatimonadaceae bacterium]
MISPRKIFIWLALGTLACQPGVPPSTGIMSATQRTSIADSVQQAVNSFIAAAARADAVGTFSYFSRSPEFTAVDNATYYTSVDRLQSVYTQIYSTIRSQEIVTDRSKIVVLSPSAALVSSILSFAAVDRAGNRSQPRPLGFTTVWVREPSGWKILHAHQSFTPGAP